MDSVSLRIFVSGISKRQMIGFALSEGSMICALMALYSKLNSILNHNRYPSSPLPSQGLTGSIEVT
jgi:hypothetical protein